MTALVLLAAAVLAWPSGAAGERLRAVTGRGARGDRGGAGADRGGAAMPAGLRRIVEVAPAPVSVPVAAGALGLLAGPLHACAAALLAGLAVELRRRARARREDLTALGAWERALEDAASALRAGAGPEAALGRAVDAADTTDPGVAAVLRPAHAHARLGGDVAAALADGRPGVARELSGAWRLSSRHGVPLAPALDELRAAVGSRHARAVRVDAALAGPRATAVILTVLPVFGVLLGSGFGADPLGVLLTGPAGGVLCLVGGGFLAAGLLWTERIVDGARG